MGVWITTFYSDWLISLSLSLSLSHTHTHTHTHTHAHIHEMQHKQMMHKQNYEDVHKTVNYL